MRYFCNRTSLLFVGVFLINSIACSHKPTLPAPSTTQNLDFTPHNDWLGLQVPYAPYEQLRKSIEDLLGKLLKNRGEAHITVLTPPEFKSLGVSMQKIEDLVREDLQKSSWRPLCVGVGEKGNLQTYYVVVEADDLKKLRNKIATLASPGSHFDPLHYYPHITLGFTERDLFETDGVFKDLKSCRFELKK